DRRWSKVEPAARRPIPPACRVLAERRRATPRTQRRRRRPKRRRPPIREVMPSLSSPQLRLAARRNRTSALRLEWPDGVVNLLPPRRLLKIVRPSAAPIGDAGL